MKPYLTCVELVSIPQRLQWSLRFGRPVKEQIQNRRERHAYFIPNAVFAYCRCQVSEQGTTDCWLAVLRAVAPGEPATALLGVTPGAEILLQVSGSARVRQVLELIDALEANGAAPIAVRTEYWRTLHQRFARPSLGEPSAGAHRYRSLLDIRARKSTLTLTAVAVVMTLIPAIAQSPYRLVYNPTDSAPHGWYGLRPAHEIRTDDWVVAWLPPTAARLADVRRYLPLNVPVLKHVAAVGGQRVCVDQGVVLIDEILVARTLAHDGAGRALTLWKGCRTLEADEVFLLSPENPASFDSRYFGPVKRSAVIGEAYPLWTKSWR